MIRHLNQVLNWMPALSAFVLPLHPRWSAWTLIIWALAWLVHRLVRPSSSIPIVRSVNDAFRWMVGGAWLYYATLVAGMFWTNDLETGWFSLEEKFSLFIVPLLMLYQVKWMPGIWRTRALLAFQAGLLIFMISRFGHAIWMGEAKYWRYDGIAGPFHPTYFAMYLSLLPILWDGRKKMGFVLFGMGAFFIGLLASKAGWFIASGMILWEGIRSFNSRFKRNGLATGLLLLLLGAGFSNQGRFEEFKDYLSTNGLERSVQIGEDVRGDLSSDDAQPGVAAPASESISIAVGSTAGRLQAWEASMEIWKKNPFGVGTGDVIPTLCEIYERDSSAYALKKKMNPHSVWLQAAVGMGWLGFLALIIWWFGGLLSAVKFRNRLLISWIVIWILNGTLESLLELQQGVVATMLIALILAAKNDAK